MKRGMGSPNYNPEKAKAARQAAVRAQQATGKQPKFVSDTAKAAGNKGRATQQANRLAKKHEHEQQAA